MNALFLKNENAFVTTKNFKSGKKFCTELELLKEKNIHKFSSNQSQNLLKTNTY